MKKLKTLLLAVLFAGAVVLPVAPVGAVDPFPACTGSSDSSICAADDDDVSDLIGTVVNTLLFIVGAVSVVMIIVGGVRFATSAGNSASVTAAKSTVLYAVIGLVIAFLAYAIVNWVFRLFG